MRTSLLSRPHRASTPSRKTTPRPPPLLASEVALHRVLVRDFLLGRLGQPWETVRAEIARLPGRRGEVLLLLIATDTLTVRGKPFYRHGTGRSAEIRPIVPESFCRGYYVCPRTGTLQFMRYDPMGR
jgi:hypothetical protein